MTCSPRQGLTKLTAAAMAPSPRLPLDHVPHKNLQVASSHRCFIELNNTVSKMFLLYILLSVNLMNEPCLVASTVQRREMGASICTE
jgi:hypothetical protein